MNQTQKSDTAISRKLRHVTSDQLHPVLDWLNIIPVYREDKIDGCDEATISYKEAVLMADLISRIADHVDEAATEGAVSYKTAIEKILRELGAGLE